MAAALKDEAHVIASIHAMEQSAALEAKRALADEVHPSTVVSFVFQKKM